MTRTRLLAHAWLQLGLWIAIALVANHLSSAAGWRLDVTRGQRHSLSPTAISAVSRLDQPLTATVWFTEDLGPPYHNHREAALDLLAGLQATSEQLDVVVRDPTGDPEAVAAARRAGIKPVTWATRNWEGSQARQVWMGVSFDHGERHTAVDALPAIERMEHDLVRAILAVRTETDKRKTVGWLTGNGEPELGSWPATHPMGALREALRARYDVVAVDASAEPIPDSVHALLIVGPQLAVPPATQVHLDAFLMRGGAIALYLAPSQPDFRAGTLRPVGHQLDALLQTWGIGISPGIVLDRKSNEVMVAPVGDGLARVNYPLAPVSTGFNRAYPPVRDLGRAVLPFVSPVHARAGENEVALWLQTEPSSVLSAAHTRLATDALAVPAADEVPGPHAVMLAAQGIFPSFTTEGQRESAPTRIVLAGSADMVANNPELVLNSVDWLLEDPRLVEIRSRQAGPALLRATDNPQLTKAAIAGAPLGTLLLLGLSLGFRRRG